MSERRKELGMLAVGIGLVILSSSVTNILTEDKIFRWLIPITVGILAGILINSDWLANRI